MVRRNSELVEVKLASADLGFGGAMGSMDSMDPSAISRNISLLLTFYDLWIHSSFHLYIAIVVVIKRRFFHSNHPLRWLQMLLPPMLLSHLNWSGCWRSLHRAALTNLPHASQFQARHCPLRMVGVIPSEVFRASRIKQEIFSNGDFALKMRLCPLQICKARN